jgi:hypothetical protein
MKTKFLTSLLSLVSLILSAQQVSISGSATVAGGATATATSAGASYSDNFNRTENPLSDGGVWSIPTDWNGFQADGANAVGLNAGSNMERVSSPSFAANQKATITLTSSINVSPGVRLDSLGRGYIVYVDSSTVLKIFEVTGTGSYSQIGGNITVTTLVAGDTLSLEATGTSTTTLVVKVNGVQQASEDDSTSPWTSGQPGIQSFGTTSINAFSAVDL